MRYFIQLSYNGKDYHGWQRQPKAPSVQEEIERALSLLLRTEIAIVGAGRTDTGVHARDYYAHFDYETPLPENLVSKLNSFLPKTIAIKAIFPVKDDAHARFDACSRTYQYFICTEKDPFGYEQHYYIHYPLDLDLMNKACEVLFNVFQKSIPMSRPISVILQRPIGARKEGCLFLESLPTASCAIWYVPLWAPF